MISFAGTPAEIGRAYGERFRDRIEHNLKVLIHREGYEPLPHGDPHFGRWVREQEALLQEWPWLLEEMGAVAEACSAGYEDILLLNLRAWQYNYYGAPPDESCSSLAVTLADGKVAAAGALDDPRDLYCGPVRVAPTGGLRFISFPITGTSWAMRGLNSAGLAIGISSQILPGLRRLPGAINQDLAMRVIFQTCDTVGDVRDFCRAHPFTMNMVCADAQGGIACLQQTAAGLFEVPAEEGWAALTNHVVDDGARRRLSLAGVREFPESDTTRARRGRLIEFCRERNGRCDREEVLALIGTRHDTDPATIHNAGSIALTYCEPQNDPTGMWFADPQPDRNVAEWVRLEV